MLLSGAWGKMIHENKLTQKVLWHWFSNSTNGPGFLGSPVLIGSRFSFCSGTTVLFKQPQKPRMTLKSASVSRFWHLQFWRIFCQHPMRGETWSFRKFPKIFAAQGAHSQVTNRKNLIKNVFLRVQVVWYCSNYLPPLSLIPVAVHFNLWISPRFLKKTQNDPNVIFKGLGEDDSWK